MEQATTMPQQKNSTWITEPRMIGFLCLTYLAGTVGIKAGVHPDFILLTPFNLLLSLVILLYNHPQWTRASIVFPFLAYGVGFGAELFGVQTGILFGEYTYLDVLGWKLWGTPLMIGVNWILVSYSAGAVINQVMERAPGWLRAIAGSLLLVFLDIFIEPVAIEYNFWTWGGGTPPLQNYIGWFLVALPLQFFFAYKLKGVKNKVGVALFILQFLFFLVLGL
jgi:putative membrane protein